MTVFSDIYLLAALPAGDFSEEKFAGIMNACYNRR